MIYVFLCPSLFGHSSYKQKKLCPWRDVAIRIEGTAAPPTSWMSCANSGFKSQFYLYLDSTYLVNKFHLFAWYTSSLLPFNYLSGLLLNFDEFSHFISILVHLWLPICITYGINFTAWCLHVNVGVSSGY